MTFVPGGTGEGGILDLGGPGKGKLLIQGYEGSLLCPDLYTSETTSSKVSLLSPPPYQAC